MNCQKSVWDRCSPLSFPNKTMLAANQTIRTPLPGAYEGFSYQGYNADALLQFDKFARTALDVYKDGAYLGMPTGNWREIRDFFSEKNFIALKKMIEARSKLPVHEQTLWETMMFIFYQIKPRSDFMDKRREGTDQITTDSYVREMNDLVMTRMISETIAAHRHRTQFMKLRKDQRDYPDTPIDTRTRLIGSMYSCDYMLR